MPDIFDHGSNVEIGQRGRNCTCDPSVPSRVRWLLRYALMLRAILRNAGVEKCEAETLGISLTVRFEIGGPEGTCTLSLPADNGLLL